MQKAASAPADRSVSVNAMDHPDIRVKNRKHRAERHRDWFAIRGASEFLRGGGAPKKRTSTQENIKQKNAVTAMPGADLRSRIFQM